ncbi:MAG: hypothetical protein LGR52_16210 [Candidatus Thiosymbion ectosymbiont of Robbea hypermnestra]|nr:hypothetical protein [Candidatus Thiosymbion ectosymbiont of Robbea hypermnestra]
MAIKNTHHRIKSSLNEERKSAIRESYEDILEQLKQHRKEHMKVAVQRPIDLTNPAWVRISPGPSNAERTNSYRFCIGFQNVGCKYREQDKFGIGCLNCGYYARTAFGDVGSSVIIDQFKSGLQRACEETTGFNSIEFLNDGSFLNPEEFDLETQHCLLQLVRQMPRVERILVESRPEHVIEPALRFILDNLRDDQNLEIGIGFESADDFVRETCINKGITITDFENAISIISSMPAVSKNRLGIVAYILVKPAFLTHRESISDVVATLDYLYDLQRRYNVNIVPKLEPAAIADGTILSLLHRSADPNIYYDPLSYWAVLEIIARFGCSFQDEPFVLRIGAREDMDDVLKAPAIYAQGSETFEPFDFVVYESIQRFNQHGNLFRLFAVISEVYLKFQAKPLTSPGSPLQRWLDENEIDSCSIYKFIEANAESICKEMENPETQYDIKMMTTIYGVLDIIEGYSDVAVDLKDEIDQTFSDESPSGLEDALLRCFEKVFPEFVLKVKIIARQETHCAELFFDVTDLLTSEKFSVWSRFYRKGVQ